LISLDPKRAIAEMHRITKPTGTVAILEVDEFHHLLLPWTGELEAALPLAIHAGSVFRYGDGVKLSPVRRLRAILKNCGFQSIQRRVYSMERVAPFDELSTNYLLHHLRYLKSLAYPNLPLHLKKEFDRLTDPDGGDSLYRLADSEMVCLNVLYLASPP
jgi:hypothetical protein